MVAALRQSVGWPTRRSLPRRVTPVTPVDFAHGVTTFQGFSATILVTACTKCREVRKVRADGFARRGFAGDG